MIVGGPTYGAWQSAVRGQMGVGDTGKEAELTDRATTLVLDWLKNRPYTARCIPDDSEETTRETKRVCEESISRKLYGTGLGGFLLWAMYSWVLPKVIELIWDYFYRYDGTDDNNAHRVIWPETNTY